MVIELQWYFINIHCDHTTFNINSDYDKFRCLHVERTCVRATTLIIIIESEIVMQNRLVGNCCHRRGKAHVVVSFA